jgi:hypothetical protein
MMFGAFHRERPPKATVPLGFNGAELYLGGVDPVRPDTRRVEVMQCTPAVSGSPAEIALSCNPPRMSS